MSVRVLPSRGLVLSSVTLLGVCASVLATGCNSEKSRNPLSPNVAGPIAGVTITSPTPLEPANGKEITAGTTVDLLIQNASTTGERPLWQQIDLALDAEFTSKIHSADRVSLGPNGRTTYRIPTALTGGRAYFWRARALDGANIGPYSNGAMFRIVVPVVIEMPIPVSPIADVVTADRRPQLVVRNTAVSGPAGEVFYRFEVATDANFSALVGSTVVARSGGETTVLQMPDLPADTRFFWRTNGTDGTVTSPWAPVQSFRTAAAPPPVTPTPPPTPPTQPPPTPPPPTSPPPPNTPAPPSDATRNISPEEALQIIRSVHDQLGYNLGSASTREQRVEFFWTAVATVHYGHARFNPRGGDPGWCVKDAGGGRPPSDDVLVRCGSRESWDLIGGAGANGYSFHLDHIGILSPEQNVYPPPRSALPR
jgi:hypothetical protein